MAECGNNPNFCSQHISFDLCVCVSLSLNDKLTRVFLKSYVDELECVKVMTECGNNLQLFLIHNVFSLFM